MKKIGVLWGMEQTFPPALIDYINDKRIKGLSAESIKLGGMILDKPLDYNVIFDRVSQEIPYYKSVLKQAAINGTRVINNPFWSCADDNFFHSALALKIGIDVPKTAIIPSKEHPPGTTSDSLKNLIYPLNWDEIFDYVGFPAYIKTNKTDGIYNAYKVYNKSEFFSAYDLTGDTVTILQEAINYDSYFHCYTIGKRDVRILNYDPTKPQHLRYSSEEPIISDSIRSEMEKLCLKICTALGFDFNAIEIEVKGDRIIAVDFLNQQPNTERSFLHDNNFEWLVKSTGDYLIELALGGKELSTQYTWSRYVRGPKSPTRKKKSKLKPQILPPENS